MTWTAIDHTAVDRPEVSRAAFGYPVVDNLNDIQTRITDATTGNPALGTRMTAVESGKVPTSRTVSTTNGLQGGGDLSANRTISPVYGTAANTVAQGNDSRITVTQDATIGNSALGTRVSALETGPLASGSWRAANSTQNIAYGTSSSDNLLVFGTAVTTPSGLTMNGTNDTVTVGAGKGGWYLITAQFDINASNTTSHLVNLSIRDGANTVTYGSHSSYYPGSAFTVGSATALVFLNAGDSFQARLGVFTGVGTGNYTNTGPGTGRTSLKAVRL